MSDFVTVLDQHARNQPDKEFLRAGERSFGYGEFAELSRRAASALSAQGLAAGDRLALLCFNTPGFIVALFGAWRLGAVVVPVNHKLQAAEIEYVLAHSGSRLCVVDGALAPVAARISLKLRWIATDSAADGMPLLEDLLAQAAPWTAAALPRPQSMAEVLYTSGTTGKPKGCLLTHGSTLTAALSASAAMSISRAERTLIAMPIWHSSPLNNWMLGTLLMGGSVVLLREYAPKAFVEILSRERITLTFGAPIAFFAPLSLVDVKSYDFSAIRLWIYGGGPLGAEMSRRLAESYGSDRFVQVYGMTEAGPLGTALHPEEAAAKAGSIGRSGMPGVAVELRAADGRRCSAGEVGEIHMRSPAMMAGYLDNPQATAEAFDADGWYRSGDLARIDEDGYLYVVDRLRDMIVTGGENVYSKEVEDMLGAHPDVQDVAVIGRPHPEWGETVTAVVVARSGRPTDGNALRDYLQPLLARYKIPRHFEFVAEVPRTATGKLLKHLLRVPA